MAVTSRELRGMTLSRLLTICLRERLVQNENEKKMERTIKATDDRLFMTALPDDDFYMGVLACKGL